MSDVYLVYIKIRQIITLINQQGEYYAQNMFKI